MRLVCVLCAAVLLFGCASGPVYMARTETESIKSIYQEGDLQRLYGANEALLRQLYYRMRGANVNLTREGLGFTLLRDQNGKRLHYLMVNVRPADLVFGVTNTKGEERFSAVMNTAFEKYLRLMRSDDLNRDDVEGLAFGLFWPVRDFSQCDTYGGFVEYVTVFLKKYDAQDFLDGKLSFREALMEAEVFVSLDSAPAVSVRPVF